MKLIDWPYLIKFFLEATLGQFCFALYLGITETSDSKISPESFDRVKKEILLRVERLCKTKLNAKNLFKAINEHAISVINYHIGVLKLEPEQFDELDDDIRAILIENRVHYQPSNKERLYLPREMLGRGLSKIAHKSEQMLLMLNQDLERSKHHSTKTEQIKLKTQIIPH